MKPSDMVVLAAVTGIGALRDLVPRAQPVFRVTDPCYLWALPATFVLASVASR